MLHGGGTLALLAAGASAVRWHRRVYRDLVLPLQWRSEEAADNHLKSEHMKVSTPAHSMAALTP